MKRKIKRAARLGGVRVFYTLTLWDEERPPAITLRARGRVKERRAKIASVPYGKAAAIGFFRKIVKGRVTPCGLADLYDDFVYENENNA